MKRVAILGSTGSIGVQTLDIVRRQPDRLKVVGLAANSQADLIRKQAAEFGVERLALMDKAAASSAGIPGGMEAVVDIATLDEADVIVVGVAGVIGLLPTIAAIQRGKHIALASKEVLVAAGELVMPMAKKHGSLITPIDSEHSAVFQCLNGSTPNQVAEIILTASGGPFRGKSRADLEKVTRQDALNHPTWKMGGKITVDSATLMNKGLEVIEAHWLFGVPLEQVSVVIHPQSVIHSMVRFKDGSVLAQMGWPDMRLPIQYALLYPDRVPNGLKPWNPVETPHLTFEQPDPKTFPSLRLAREAGKIGATMPCVLNAANEEAANGFLQGKCRFVKIPEIVEKVMARHAPGNHDLDHILRADKWARETARKLMESM